MSDNNKRRSDIDLLKGWAMFLMIFNHAHLWGGMKLYTFHLFTCLCFLL
jgi:uncharacterized membrane protein